MYLGQYQGALSRRINKQTWRRYSRILDDFFARFPDRKYVHEIYATDINDYKLLRRAEGRKESTITEELSVLRNFFRWLIEEQFLNFPNPLNNTELRKGSHGFQPLTWSSLEWLFQAAESSGERALLWLGMITGESMEELSTLRWGDFLWKENCVRVAGKRHYFRPDVMDIFRQVREERVRLRGPVSKDDIWPRLKAKAGLQEGLTFRALHATLAAVLARSGVVPLKTLKGLLQPWAFRGAVLELEPETAENVRKFAMSLPLTLSDHAAQVQDETVRSPLEQMPTTPQTTYDADRLVGHSARLPDSELYDETGQRTGA